MRRSFIVAAGMAAIAGSPAVAADLGSPEPLPTPPAVQAAPSNDWTGFYLGVLGGWTWANADTDAPGVGSIDADGWDLGADAGYNWQFNNFVVGAEGDVMFSGVDGDEGGISVDQGVNGSLRARAGYALDNFLLYGTGGVAATDLELDDGAGSDDQMLWGWTIGAGAEALLARNITARVEYRYTDYQDETFTLGGGNVDSDFDTHSVRAGVGIKF
jgi:outer membrane immunogenic protein